jgi:two-component system, OmpR family, alkaline phosphatase synthesis response regulator PhoP
MHLEMTNTNKAETSGHPKINLKIAVIEDDLHISELIHYNLEAAGYLVVTAHDGENGYRMITEEKPDFVILDMMLPRIDGLKVCSMIRSSEMLSATPVIILTGKFSEIDRINGLEAGADDCIPKPFSILELKARINAILKHRKS